jgi:hypothetical protein
MKDKINLTISFIAGAVLGALIIWLVQDRSVLQDLEIKVAGPENKGSVFIGVKAVNPVIRIDSALDNIFQTDPVMSDGIRSWLSKEHDLYEIEDEAYIEYLRELDYHSDKSSKVRNLLCRREGPFNYEFRDIIVGFPEEGEPPEGRAYVWGDSEFRSSRVEIYGVDDKNIRVFSEQRPVLGHRQPEGSVDIHLNRNDGLKILPMLSRRDTLKAIKLLDC